MRAFFSIAAPRPRPVSALSAPAAEAQKPVTLLNVSYDPTRELYQDVNAAFATYWKEKTGQDVTIQQSHGGSGKQARSVIDGLEADVVTLALAYDIDAIAPKARLLPADWQKRLPEQQRALHLDDRLPGAQGQSEGDQGLGRPDPAGRLGHHAQSQDLGRCALELPGGVGLRAAAAGRQTRRRPRSSSPRLYKNVPVLDSGARGSTTTFVQRGIGDVLLAWENEAFLAIKELGPDKFEIVVPSVEHPGRAAGHRGRQGRRKHGTHEVAKAYLEYLYSRRGAGDRRQALLPAAAARRSRRSTPPSSRKVTLFTIDEVFGGWAKAQATALRRRWDVRPDLSAARDHAHDRPAGAMPSESTPDLRCGTPRCSTRVRRPRCCGEQPVTPTASSSLPGTTGRFRRWIRQLPAPGLGTGRAAAGARRCTTMLRRYPGESVAAPWHVPVSGGMSCIAVRPIPGRVAWGPEPVSTGIWTGCRLRECC